MLFAIYRDFDPEDEFYDCSLGLQIHDDGDVIKWDWSIYKREPDADYTADLRMYKMYSEVHSIDVSPYERDKSKIKDMFRQWVLLDRQENNQFIAEQDRFDEWHEGPVFSK